MADDGDDPDSAMFIVGVVLLAFLCLAILRFCDYCCKKTFKQQPEEDVEHLDHSIEIKSGCWRSPIFTSIFTCCSETSGESESQHESDNGNEEPKCNEASPQATDEEVKSRGQEFKDVAPKRSVDISSITVALNYLQRQQQTESSETSTAKLTRIRLVQNLLQLDTKANRPTEESMGVPLIIGVDATPKVLGGYCVNLREMRVDYYVIKMDDFPWPMEHLNDPVEFEMKNLQFALAIWSESIRKFKRFKIYTDNNGICGSSEYGRDAEDLLSHFTNCEGVTLVGKDEVYVNRIQDLTAFAKFIQPADDLSRWQVDKAVEFLCKFYGIKTNRAKGTVKLTRHGTTETKPWYDPSDAYQAKLDLAQMFAYKFHCANCDISLFG